MELLRVSAEQVDSTYRRNLAPSQVYKRVYRSGVMGLDNRWDLCISNDSVAVISIRGTTRNNISWLQNFYAAMVPATGQLNLSPDFVFNYKLAENDRATVHVGWLIGAAYLSRDILPQLQNYYQRGYKNFIILGHSQGGAIAYLVTAYLKHLQLAGKLPLNIRFKTYGSAAPKPGNVYFAYDYEALTANGWAFNVVNTADWVPETPISIQTLGDFNPTNPFKNAGNLIKKQPFPKNLAYRYLYNQLKKPTEKAARKYQKYLGQAVGKLIKKQLPTFVPPTYAPSSNYARTGQTIVLQADEAYYQKFPEDEQQVFTHHHIHPYLFLAQKLK